MKHLINLNVDLDTLAHGGSSPTQNLTDVLHRDLMAVVASGASKPASDTERLVYKLDVVMNRTLATPSEVIFALNHSQTLLQGAGATRTDMETIVGRYKSVALR